MENVLHLYLKEMSYMSPTVKGYLAADASAVSYGMNPLGALSLYKEGLTSDCVLFYRFFLASMLLAFYMLYKRESFRIEWREALLLLFLGSMFAISSLTYYSSFYYMDVGVSTTLLFIYPVMVASIMALFFGERLTLSVVLSIVGALSGVVILYLGGDAVLSLVGVVLVFLSALSYALYMVVVNRTKPKLSAVKLTFYAALFCSALIFLHSTLFGVGNVHLLTTGSQWFWVSFLALFPGLISLLMMAVAVRNVGSTKTSIMGALEPLTAVCIGVFVFGEQMTYRLALGIVLVVGAVLLVIVSPQIEKRRSEAQGR